MYNKDLRLLVNPAIHVAKVTAGFMCAPDTSAKANALDTNANPVPNASGSGPTIAFDRLLLTAIAMERARNEEVAMNSAKTALNMILKRCALLSVRHMSNIVFTVRRFKEISERQEKDNEGTCQHTHSQAICAHLPSLPAAPVVR
jgi:hypothetical protein